MTFKSHINRVVTSLVASVVALSALSHESPRLVLGVIIDQLSQDRVDELLSSMGRNGFNRVLRDGACFDGIGFTSARVDRVSGAAVLCTGAYARVNGIEAATIYDVERKASRGVYFDAAYMGNFTSETYSPRAISVNTFTDELKLSSGGKGRVYAIAVDASMAITLAGHAANGAYWINDNTGRWATTTFYREMPPCLQERNYSKALSLRVDTMKWEPLPATKTRVKDASFYYNFNRNDASRYERYKSTPLANSEVVDVAIDYIDCLNLGNGEATDCIQLGMSAAVPQWCAAGKGEEVDTYLRLDADLGRLLNAIDAKVGLKNVLVYITSTGSYPDNRDFDARYNLPQGVFNTERACSLLNVYLMALLGPGEWVECGNGVEFYLNRTLIKSRGLDIDDIGAKARDFLAQMEGVADAFTSHDILTARSTDGRFWAWRNSVVKGRCADVVVDLNAGWRLQPNNNDADVSFRANYGNVSCPLYIMSPQVASKRLHATYDAAQVAPTVARLCRIRSPNGAAFPPLPIQ